MTPDHYCNSDGDGVKQVREPSLAPMIAKLSKTKKAVISSLLRSRRLRMDKPQKFQEVGAADLIGRCDAVDPGDDFGA